MSIQHPTLKAEVLYVIGRATAPLSTPEIYDRCEQAEDVAQISKAVWQLANEGRIERIDGEGRARYRLVDGQKAPAPAGKAGRSKAVQRDDAKRESTAAMAEICGRKNMRRSDPANPPAPAEKNTVAEAEKMVAATLRELAAEYSAPPESTSNKADASLADAILARLKRDLAPVFGKPVVSDLDISTAPGIITINVERVEIHISVGVQA